MATVATIIPPMVILSLVSYFYALFADNPYVAAVLAGMQAGVAAVIVDVVLNLGTGVVKTRRWLLDVIMVAAFAAAHPEKKNGIILTAIRTSLTGSLSAVFSVPRRLIKRSRYICITITR